MPISSTAELLAVLRDWKAAGLPLSRTSHPAVSGNSDAYFTLLRILNQQDPDPNRASDGRTNTAVLREFYEAVMAETAWPLLEADYTRLTGGQLPASPAEWMALAAEYDFPTYGTGAFSPRVILAWVVGRLRRSAKAADQPPSPVIAPGIPEATSKRKAHETESPPSVPPVPVVTSNIDPESAAVACLFTHPDWDLSRIAKEVGVARQTLYDWPKFLEAAGLAGKYTSRKRRGRYGRKGFKTRDGHVEAVDTDPEEFE